MRENNPVTCGSVWLLFQDVTGIINMRVRDLSDQMSYPHFFVISTKSYMYKIVHYKQSLIRTTPSQPSIGIVKTFVQTYKFFM